MWLNESEIDHAVEVLNRAAPEIAPYAQYLSDWRDVVNAHSDGWPYWRAGNRPAEKLGALVSAAVNSVRHHGEMPAEIAFKKALAPIRSAATRFNLTAPELKIEMASPAP